MTTATPSISVTSREPCPICGGEKRCLVSASGSIVRCYRESKGCLRAKLDCQGVAYWVHRGPSFVELNEDPLPVPNGEIADADNRNRVYAALLSKLGLSAEHRAALKVRGLDDYEINTRRYATVTGKPWNAAKYLRSKFDDEVLVQIPGLVVKAGKEPGTTYLSIAAPPGLLIPVRDEQGRIVALAIRPDKNDGSGKYKFLSSGSTAGPRQTTARICPWPNVPQSRSSGYVMTCE